MNNRIQEAIDLTKQVLGDALRGGRSVACSVSGGADSDILIDLCERTQPHFVKYVFFDTGIEYQATKEHLSYLERKYDIKIERERAKVPVPLGNKKYGVPFLNKSVSDMISRLQAKGFQWEDDTYENLCKRYENCKCALKWWTNCRGEGSHYNISRNTWLKEFMVKNPPKFQISAKCCSGAKKHTSDNYTKNNSIDIMIVGVRKAEGGQRATAYKSQLYYNTARKCDYYLPILYFTNSDREEYEREYEVIHSRCYTEYGLARTGCAGCPYGRDYQFERGVVEQYDSKLSAAIENMWREVYEYTDKYHEFQKMMNRKYKEKKQCVCGCTEFTGDDVAMNLKYFGRDVKTLLCRGCFQNVMEMSDVQWDEAIEDFKSQGCQLF